jgi:hypothetical protein
MYQWKEIEHTSVKTDKDGKAATTTSYSYEKIWSAKHLDVHHSPGNRNPTFPKYDFVSSSHF